MCIKTVGSWLKASFKANFSDVYQNCGVTTESKFQGKKKQQKNNVPGGDVWPADSGRIPYLAAGLCSPSTCNSFFSLFFLFLMFFSLFFYFANMFFLSFLLCWLATCTFFLSFFFTFFSVFFTFQTLNLKLFPLLFFLTSDLYPTNMRTVHFPGGVLIFIYRYRYLLPVVVGMFKV